MIERWNRDQVLALAPDAPSQKAAHGVSSPAKWSGTGVSADALWGECKGSGSKPYRACVDLSEPAYKCTCPSRKFPCKHALGLLLLWSADAVPAADEPADWVGEWLEGRRGRAAKAAEAGAARAAKAAEAGPSDGRRAGQREQRVAAGLADLERWLADQIRQGIAGSRRNDQWDTLAKRLVDAQAPGVAGSLSRLGGTLNGDDWPARLLGEYALLHLLCVAHRRLSASPTSPGSSADGTGPQGGTPDDAGARAGADAGADAGAAAGGVAPAGLLQRVRDRVGFSMTKEEVIAHGTVRDRWDVLGRRDEEHDRLTARRVWLRGRETGRSALVLSFAPAGQALDASLVTGTTVDADLAFYPGSAPLRAVVAARHETPGTVTAERMTAGTSAPGTVTAGQVTVRREDVGAGPPPGTTVPRALDEVAEALAGDPWLDSWPLLLEGVVPAGNDLRSLTGPSGGLALHPSVGTPWRLAAVSGGHPVTVAAEWTPRGLRPLTTWDEEGRVIVL